MARKSEADELEELVDELEDLELEEETEVEADPDEAPKKSRRKRTTKTTAKAEKPAGVSTRDVADAAGIEPRQLRMFLRASGYQPKDEREGRYSWKSMNDPEVKEILKKIKAGEVNRLNKEKLADLKGRKKAKAS